MNRLKHLNRTRMLWTAAGSLLCGATALVACTGVEDPSRENHVGSAAPAGESIANGSEALTYTEDFFDGFDGSSLNTGNWQSQYVWVNNELQCYDNDYNEGGQHRTLEVGGGSLKLRVVDSGVSSNCDNWDKNGNKHPNTRYRAARIASKNRKEFAGGKWTARLKFYTWKYASTTGQPSGLAGMFPAWWLLGARNNESPVQQGDENVCWPLTGSGEIDILEHYGASGQNRFTARGIKSLGYCNGGDWQTYQRSASSDFGNFHEYQVENSGSDLIYRVDNNEVARNSGIGGNYPEPMFAILNYALKDSNMDGAYKEYAMDVDWVKHESASSGGGGGGGGGAGSCAAGTTVGLKANASGKYASSRSDVSGVPVRAQASSIQGWEQFDIVDAGGGYVGLKSHTNNLYVSADMNDSNKSLKASWATSIGGWEKFQFVPAGNGWYGIKAAANGLFVSADLNLSNAPLEAKWAATIGGWEQFQCVQ